MIQPDSCIRFVCIYWGWMVQLLTEVNVVSPVGAGSARPSPPVVILLSQRAGKPRPYKACHLGSHFSNNEAPENEFPGACFCLFLLFTEIEQKNFISLL